MKQSGYRSISLIIWYKKVFYPIMETKPLPCFSFFSLPSKPCAALLLLDKSLWQLRHCILNNFAWSRVQAFILQQLKWVFEAVYVYILFLNQKALQKWENIFYRLLKKIMTSYLVNGFSYACFLWVKINSISSWYMVIQSQR